MNPYPPLYEQLQKMPPVEGDINTIVARMREINMTSSTPSKEENVENSKLIETRKMIHEYIQVLINTHYLKTTESVWGTKKVFVPYGGIMIAGVRYNLEKFPAELISILLKFFKAIEKT